MARKLTEAEHAKLAILIAEANRSLSLANSEEEWAATDTARAEADSILDGADPHSMTDAEHVFAGQPLCMACDPDDPASDCYREAQSFAPGIGV